MKTSVVRILCFALIAGALACRIFIPDKTLGSIIAIVLLVVSVTLFSIYRIKRR